MRAGQVVPLSKIPAGARFRLTLDGKHGWLTLVTKHPGLPADGYTKGENGKVWLLNVLVVDFPIPANGRVEYLSES